MLAVAVLALLAVLRLDRSLRGWAGHVASLTVVAGLMLSSGPWDWALAASLGVLLAGLARLPAWRVAALGGVLCLLAGGGWALDRYRDAQAEEALQRQRSAQTFSLLGETGGTSGGRKWSDSYLALTKHGRPNPMVNWLNVQSIPPMLPPYFAGSAKSKIMSKLKGGHGKTKLSQEELDKIACWIDLLIPYCGDYMEANAWGEGGVKKYKHFLAKRKRMEAIELENIRALSRQ